MDRDFAGLELDIDDLAVALDIVHRLIEDVVFRGVAWAEFELAVEVRAGDEAHTAIVDIGVVNGQPDGYRLGRRQRPVAGVLVPRDGGAIFGHLAEVVRG